MKENFSMLKKWFGLIQPDKKETIFQFFLRNLMVVISILLPLPAAKAIVSLTKQDYKIAIIYLTITLFLNLLHKVIAHFFYMSTAKVTKTSFAKLQDKIYSKLCVINKSEIDKSSKEKLLNVLLYNAFTASSLTRFIPFYAASLMMAIVILTIVCFINIYIGIALVFIATICYIISNKFNIVRAFWVKKQFKANDEILNQISNMIDKKDLIQNFNLEQRIKKDYMYTIDKRGNEVENKLWFTMSLLDNWFTIIYMMLIYGITIALVFLLSNNIINLTLYLILVPYVTNFVTSINEFLVILQQIKKGYVAANRVKSFLDSDEREMIEFGDNESDDILGNIKFKNVSYQNNNKEEISYGKINNLSFDIKHSSICLIKGSKKSGKRQIFYLLNRYIKQEKGNILLDNISIYDYDKKVYKSNISSLVYKPTFFNGSILKNFKVLENNKKKIIKVCKKVGIHDYILSLSKGYKTDINKNINIIPKEKQFLIALARTILTKSEVILIYEFPASLSNDELIRIKQLLISLKQEKTIIIFTALDVTDDIADKTIDISRGKQINENINK